MQSLYDNLYRYPCKTNGKRVNATGGSRRIRAGASWRVRSEYVLVQYGEGKHEIQGCVLLYTDAMGDYVDQSTPLPPLRGIPHSIPSPSQHSTHSITTTIHFIPHIQICPLCQTTEETLEQFLLFCPTPAEIRTTCRLLQQPYLGNTEDIQGRIILFTRRGNRKQKNHVKDVEVTRETAYGIGKVILVYTLAYEHQRGSVQEPHGTCLPSLLEPQH